MFTHVVETKMYGSGRKFSRRRIQLFTGMEEVQRYVDFEKAHVDPEIAEKLFRVWPITADPEARFSWKYSEHQRRTAREAA